MIGLLRKRPGTVFYRTFSPVFFLIPALLILLPTPALGDFVPWDRSRSPEPADTKKEAVSDEHDEEESDADDKDRKKDRAEDRHPPPGVQEIAKPDPSTEHEEPDYAEDEEYEILGRRVVSEETVEEMLRPSGGSSVAPATRNNAPFARSNDRPSPGIFGSTGFPMMSTARTGVPGSFRLAMTGEFFSGDDFLVNGDNANRQSITFAAGYTPLDWLETYGSVSFISVTNDHSSPQLMQIQGDMLFGLKAAYHIAAGIHLGADLGLSLFPNIGSVGIGAAGLHPGILASIDMRDLLSVITDTIPVIFHYRAGFIFDGTNELAGGDRLNRMEEFALGISKYNRFEMGAGIEIPLPVITPFGGWRMQAPMGDVLVPQVRDDDGSLRWLTYDELVKNYASFGARITAFKDLSFMASLDIGVSGATVDGWPATMPWNLVFGISYVIDPDAGGELIRTHERIVEVDRAVPAPPSSGMISGTVRDINTNEPLNGAIIEVASAASFPVATSSEGYFRAREIPPGTTEILVFREGYRLAERRAEVVAGGNTIVDFMMERSMQPGSLVLNVTGGNPPAPISAKVQVHGPENKTLRTDSAGLLEARLGSGAYVLNISAEGFLTRQRNFKIEEGTRTIVDMDLAEEPSEALVTLGDGKLELTRQIHFLTGQATILPDSYQILDQVMDLIARHNIEKIRIEGHTDNEGSRAMNMELSNARANAVLNYLKEKGISPDRMEAEGFGPDRPIAPNLTQRGRAMNRRVEFHIAGFEKD